MARYLSWTRGIRRWKFSPDVVRKLKRAHSACLYLVDENIRLKAEVDSLRQANFQLQVGIGVHNGLSASKANEEALKNWSPKYEKDYS